MQNLTGMAAFLSQVLMELLPVFIAGVPASIPTSVSVFVQPIPEKRKRPRLSDLTKMNIVEESKKAGFSHETIMKRYNIGQASLYKILKDERYSKPKLLDETTGEMEYLRDVKSHMKPKYPDFEKMLAQWVIQTQKHTGQLLGGPVIKKQAQQIASDMHIVDLKFSNGWLFGFRKRHGLNQDAPELKPSSKKAKSEIRCKNL